MEITCKIKKIRENRGDVDHWECTGGYRGQEGGESVYSSLTCMGSNTDNTAAQCKKYKKERNDQNRYHSSHVCVYTHWDLGLQYTGLIPFNQRLSNGLLQPEEVQQVNELWE